MLSSPLLLLLFFTSMLSPLHDSTYYEDRVHLPIHYLETQSKAIKRPIQNKYGPKLHTEHAQNKTRVFIQQYGIKTSQNNYFRLFSIYIKHGYIVSDTLQGAEMTCWR
jgi:hypothetical protein